MALPPIDMGPEDLEETDPNEAEGDDDLDDMPEDGGVASDLDPMFAADAGEAFPDLDDAGLAALQRAILSLISGGGAPPPPAAPPGGAPMGF